MFGFVASLAEKTVCAPASSFYQWCCNRQKTWQDNLVKENNNEGVEVCLKHYRHWQRKQFA